MENKNPSAIEYHETTKLGYINLKTKPILYKSYNIDPAITLEGRSIEINTPTLDCVDLANSGQSPVGLTEIATLLNLSSGIIKSNISTTAGPVDYRAASSAGALYPIETYLICGDLQDIPAGIYHFSPKDNVLIKIAEGDYRALLSSGRSEHQEISNSPIVLVYTSIIWRSTWKYRARGYRYSLWDNGTILSNLINASNALGIPNKLYLGFIDNTVNDLLGLDGVKEAATCMVTMGAQSVQHVHNPTHNTIKVNPDYNNDIEYDEVTKMHQATKINSPSDLDKWLTTIPERYEYPAGESELSTTLIPPIESRSIHDTITNRGSTRRFQRTSISKTHLIHLLNSSTNPAKSDFLNENRPSLLEFYFIVNSVEGVPRGAYYYSLNNSSLELIKSGNFRSDAGHLCFEQALGYDSSVVAFIMADLTSLTTEYGDRGYRAAQIEAGMRGGQLYLSAYSLGLGASGITFYDDSVTEFFSPHASTATPMFVVTIGKTSNQNSVRPFRSKVAVKLDAMARGAGQIF